MKVKEEKIKGLPLEGYYQKPINQVVLHNIFTNKIRCGVYKIMFGDKYYIGQSVHVIKRLRKHVTEINKIFCSPEPTGKLGNIISHIRASEITSIHAFVLEDCQECDLLKTEQKWLSLSEGDKDCLNTNFISHANPSIRISQNFKPVTIKTDLLLSTPRELKLYNDFLSDLNSIKHNPRINLKKWF